MSGRRFPPPWSIDELEACFVVIDSDGQKLGHCYFEEEPGRRSAAKLLSKDEARRIAANTAKLPEAVAEDVALIRIAPLNPAQGMRPGWRHV